MYCKFNKASSSQTLHSLCLSRNGLLYRFFPVLNYLCGHFKNSQELKAITLGVNHGFAANMGPKLSLGS